MRRVILWTGLVLGTCIVTLAYMDGARPALPGVPHWLGLALGAVLVWLALAALVATAAEMLRRHHRTIAVHAGRHGKRATIATARAAGKGGRSIRDRLASWAGPRWAARSPVSGSMGWATPEATAERQAQRDAVPPPGLAPGRTRNWWQLAGGHDVVAEPDLVPAGTHPRLSKQQVQRDIEGKRNDCAACGNPGTPGDPLVIAPDGFRVHTSHTADPADGYYNPASAPAPAVASQNGDSTMTSIPEWPGDRMPRSTPTRTRLPAQVKANAPSGWKALAATASDFEPDTDDDLLDWLASEVAGISTYSEALTDIYETCVSSVRLDPVAMSSLHDAADAAADFATSMAYARQRFAAHYSEVREFVSGGGILPKDGDFITGEGDD
jgi:hypothetical protein